MSGHEFGNDPAKVARYKAFWDLEDTGRPLVGFSMKSWFPLEEFAASAAWPTGENLEPEMVHPPAFVADQERLLREGEEMDDDIFRGASPSQAVPWLCAMAGNRLRILPGSILAEERVLTWEELEDLHLDRNNAWYRRYMDFARVLAKASGGRYPVSHGTLVGPSDVAAALRGHSQSIVDLVEEPARAHKLLGRCSEMFQEITEDIWRELPLFHGGYYDAQYQLWAPGSIIRMQEDATALYSPRLYREFILDLDRQLATRFDSSFIHLHSTSMFLLDDFLEIEEIRCFEVNNDVSGPPIERMIPHFKRIQDARRPLLIRGSFTADETRMLMDHLTSRGLYLYIMIADMREMEALRPLLGM